MQRQTKKKNKNRNYNNNELFICLVEIANEKAKHRCTCAEYVMTEYLIQFRSNIYGVSRTLLLLSSSLFMQINYFIFVVITRNFSSQKQ